MVHLGLQSVTRLAPLLGCIVAGLSDPILALKPANEPTSPSGLSPASETLPSSINSSALHPPESAVLNSKVANLTDGPRFQCLVKYGATLVPESCLEAFGSIPLDPLPYVFGRRSRPNVQVGLPYRFLSGASSSTKFRRCGRIMNGYLNAHIVAADGTCAIDIGMGSLGSADADVVSWSILRDAAHHLVDECVLGSPQRNPGLGGINRYLGMSGHRPADRIPGGFSNTRHHSFRSSKCHQAL